MNRFLLVGGVSFSTNVLVLFLLHGLLDMNLLLAQIVAAESAIFISFCLHHQWTYRNYRERPLFVRFLHFNGSAFGGQLIATLTLLFCVNVLGMNYLIGFSIGAILALAWNYFSNKYFIWSQATQ